MKKNKKINVTARKIAGQSKYRCMKSVYASYAVRTGILTEDPLPALAFRNKSGDDWSEVVTSG
jgi:hypothetical protein